MLESNKKRSERKKREKAAIASRFAPYGAPFEDDPVISESIVRSIPYPVKRGLFADMTIGWALAVFLLVLVVI
jgi:hypothetical protein